MEIINLQSIPKQAEHVAWSQIDDEAILLNLDNGLYYTLNEVGCDAWQFINAQRSISDIGREMCALYEVEPEQVEQDLCNLFQHLLQEQLVLMCDPESDQREV